MWSRCKLAISKLYHSPLYPMIRNIRMYISMKMCVLHYTKKAKAKKPGGENSPYFTTRCDVDEPLHT